MVEFTVVIPTFNEEKHIAKTMRSILNNLFDLNLHPEVIVVDDSTDSTADILKGVQGQFPVLRVIHRKNATGVGSAIRLGIEKAKGKYIIVYMADAPDDIKYFPVILSKLRQGYDIVQTSRFFRQSRIEGYPFRKRVCNWACNTFINLAFLEFKLRDFSSLFKAFSRKRVLGLKLEATKFDLGLEIVLKAMKKNYRIVEVPVDWKEREAGESKLKLSRYAKDYFFRVVGIWLSRPG